MASLPYRREMLTEDVFTDEIQGEEISVATQQIKIEPGGIWHRRGPKEGETACGQEFLGCALRDYVAHVPDLCDECFTKHERDLDS